MTGVDGIKGGTRVLCGFTSIRGNTLVDNAGIVPLAPAASIRHPVVAAAIGYQQV